LGSRPALLFVTARPRFDLDTFTGRLKHFANVTSPLTLFASKQQLDSAKETVKAYENAFSNDAGKPFLVSRSEARHYWKAKQLVDSSIHPDT
jgi:sideroflexin-5